MLTPSSIFSAKNITCTRKGTAVFTNLSFTVKGGEALVIHGANGSGKSSLLRILCGIASPASGTVLWQGSPIQTNDFLYDCHYLGHANGNKLNLSVSENLMLFAQLNSCSTPRLDESLKQYRLSHLKNKIVSELSSGQKRRVALARLALIPKKIWILDEPLNALDEETQGQFMQHLHLHLQQQRLALITTHHVMNISKLYHTQVIDLSHAH